MIVGMSNWCWCLNLNCRPCKLINNRTSMDSALAFNSFLWYLDRANMDLANIIIHHITCRISQLSTRINSNIHVTSACLFNFTICSCFKNTHLCTGTSFLIIKLSMRHIFHSFIDFTPLINFIKVNVVRMIIYKNFLEFFTRIHTMHSASLVNWIDQQLLSFQMSHIQIFITN
jgi:hypothetical protein